MNDERKHKEERQRLLQNRYKNIRNKKGCGKKGIVGSNDMVYVMRQRGAGQSVTHHTTPHPVHLFFFNFLKL